MVIDLLLIGSYQLIGRLANVRVFLRQLWGEDYYHLGGSL